MLGWAWQVMPSSTALPMVATGHSSTQARAMGCVEEVLDANEDSAMFGMVFGPRGEADMCRRTTRSKFYWTPMLATLENKPSA